ncbi:MAG: hypothetical protein RDV41_14380, partial [Planctomycetota bacterium]|nr:hypothetical protein [Planctomycetota bacterium]
MIRLSLLPLVLLLAVIGCVSPASVGLSYMREIDVADWGIQKLNFEHVEGVKLVKGDNPYDCGPEALAALLNYFRSDNTSVQQVAKDLGATPTTGTASPQIPIYLRARGLPANMQAGSVTLLRQNCLIGNPCIIMVDAAAVPDSPIPLAERESVFHYFVVIGYCAESRQIACAGYDGGCVLIDEDYLQKAWSKAGNYVVVVGNLAPEIVASTAGGAPGTGELLRDYTAEQHFDFGAVYEDEGRLEDALAQYNFCLKRDPRFALAHVGLGNISMRKGNRDEALRGYKRA